MRYLVDLEESFGILPTAERVIGGYPGGRYGHDGERRDDQRKDRSDFEIHVPISIFRRNLPNRSRTKPRQPCTRKKIPQIAVSVRARMVLIDSERLRDEIVEICAA